MKVSKVYSDFSPKLIEHVGIKSWRVRWNICKVDDGYSYYELDCSYKPTLEEIRDIIIETYNKDIDDAILSGFTWNGFKIWLSSENQFNYKTAYDLAVQTNGATLPVTFKFGTSESPEYYEFDSLSTLSDFYTKAVNHVISTLSEGWKLKDSINLAEYLDNTGTEDDPIPYVKGMILELGKYYTQNNIMYMCYKDSVKSVSEDLENSNYITKV